LMEDIMGFISMGVQGLQITEQMSSLIVI